MAGGQTWQQDQHLCSTQQLRRFCQLGFLVVIWYYFSYEYNTRLKAWLSVSRQTPLPTAASLGNAAASSASQFIAVASSSWLSPVTLPLLIAIFSTTTAATLPWVLNAYRESPQLLHAWRYLWSDHTLDMSLMCASTVMGTATITIVYEYGSIQLVQVARSVGPLFTTIWAVLLLDQVIRGKPLACLLASLAGTMLASWKEPTLCVMTVVLMIAANACMTFRNVITRRLLTALGISRGHHGQHISSLEPGHSPRAEFAAIPSTHMASLLLTTGNAAGCCALIVLLATGAFSGSHAVAALADMPLASIQKLMLLGGTNWAYNLASQLVLAQLTVVSHGMLELLKRVFVLVAVSVFAQKAHWQWHNVLGAVITFMAAALYFHFSHAHPSSPPASRAQSGEVKVFRAEEEQEAGPLLKAWNNNTSKDTSFSFKPCSRQSEPASARAGKQSSSNGGAPDGMALVHVGTPDLVEGKGSMPSTPQQTSSQASSPCCGCLPAPGPRRVRLARTTIVLVMLCSLPLLLPSSVWLTASAQSATQSVSLQPTSGTTSSSTAAEASVRAYSPPLSKPPMPPVWGSTPDQAVPGFDLDTVSLLPAEVPVGSTPLAEPSRSSGGNRAAMRNKGGSYQATRGRSTKSPRGRTMQSNSAPQTLYGILMGWLGHDNLGDEIVADIFYELFRRAVAEVAPRGAKVEFVAEMDKSLSWRYEGCGRDRVYDHCHFAVIGGGSTVDVPFIKAAKPMLAARRPVMLFGGGHQRVYHNRTLEEECLDLLSKANVMGGVRGPITRQFLLNRTGTTFPVLGDSGFLSEVFFQGQASALTLPGKLPAPIRPGAPIPHWPPSKKCLVSSRRHSRHPNAGIRPELSDKPGGPCERPLVVVTLRTELTSADLFKDANHFATEEDIENLKVDRHPVAIMMLMIEELVNEHNFQVVLQAVDQGSLDAHQRYLAMINRRIRPGNPPVTMHNEHQNYHSVMELYSRAAVTVNCRLHSGIVAASALRPTIYMASLPKFQDFMDSIGQGFLMVNPNRPENKFLTTIDLAKLMVSRVLHAATNAADISRKLQQERDAMLKRYQEAMRALLDRIAMEQPDSFASVVQQCKHIKISRSDCKQERTVVNVQCAKQ